MGVRKEDLPPRWSDAADEEHNADRATALFSHARDVETRHQSNHENNLLYAQLYSNREMPSFDWGYGVNYDPSLNPVSRLSENLALSVVDTMVSHIGKNRPKPTVVLKGAPWKLRTEAKKLDRWLYGNFLNYDVYEKGKEVFRDAGIFGFGALRIDVVGRRMCVDRVFPDDVLVDQRECHGDRQPVHIFIRKVMTVQTVVESFGLDEDTVRAAAKKPYVDYRGVGDQHVVVIEAFRRAIRGPKGKIIPGRRVLALDGVILDEEKWDEEWFPVVFFRWARPPSGWYGASLVEQVLPYQIRLNEINEVIREAQDLMARPRILIPEGSRINVNQLDNVIGKIIRYTGALKPEALNWQAVSAELYGERDRLVRSCYEFLGISQISAQQKMPANFRADSSLALQEMNAIDDGRHADLAQRFELFYLEVAETMVRVAQRYGVNVSSSWWSGGKKGKSQTICWDEIDLDADSYVLTLEPSSVLNQTPAARRDELERMLARQEITPAQYAAHFENPDIESIHSLAGAAEEDITRVISLLEREEYEEPNEFQDLATGLPRVHLAYLRLGEWEDVPESVYQGFESWMLHAKSILDGMASAQQPAASLQAAPLQ